MRGNKKLYRFTSPSFLTYSHLDARNRIVTRECDSVPMVQWPNGRWCYEANLYIQKQFERGLSRRGRGGTLLTYVTQISALIRFCYQNHTEFIDLTDSQFSFFVKTLAGETESLGRAKRKRSTNSVVAIGRRCLDFLAFVGEVHDDENFIGPKGRIIATKESAPASKVMKGKGNILVRYWFHRALPQQDRFLKRLPITTENAIRIRKAVLSASSSTFQRKRRYVLLTLFEVTGARRYELSRLTVKNVLDAWSSPEPRLTLVTAKRGGNREVYRELPISRIDLAILVEYIEKNRARVIRKTCGCANDDGLLLVSQTTGKGLKPNTISQEIYALAKHAGIDEKVCAHMYRHAFFTKLFVALIEQHRFENSDDFRRALLEVETVKKVVQEWSGHRSLHSLEPYIHLAFNEYSGFSKTVELVHMRRLLQSFSAALSRLTTEMEEMSPVDALTSLREVVRLGIADLERMANQ